MLHVPIATRIAVTHLQCAETTYDPTEVGYPWTGTTTRRLSAADHPRFDEWIAKLLAETLYYEQATVGAVVRWHLAGDTARIRAVEQGRNRPSPSGSGRNVDWSLYDGDTHVYTFDLDLGAYSGQRVRLLFARLAAPSRGLFDRDDELGKLVAFAALRRDLAGYARDVARLARVPAPLRWTYMAGQGGSDFEHVSPWVDELERMPGGTPGLHGAARAMVDAVFPFDRAHRMVVRSCVADDGPPRDIVSRYTDAMTLYPRFAAARRRLHDEVETWLTGWLARCPDGDLAACRALRAGRALLDAHERGEDVTDAVRAVLASTEPLVREPRVAALADKVRSLPETLVRMGDDPLHRVLEAELLEVYASSR